jgi:dihydrofolate reductase
MNTTLDGIVSDELIWMKQDTDQTWDSLFDMLFTVDLLLLGGGMWKDYSDYWKGALINPGFTQNEIKYAQFADKTRHVVFSSSMQDTDWKNATIITGDLKQNIQQLKSEKGKDIQIVGGAQFASNIINTGLVDEYRIMLNPFIFGRGKSLYSNLLHELSLECFKVEHMENGVVILSYKQNHTENLKKTEPLM